MTFNDEQKLFADSAWMLFNNKESILADPQIANIHVNMQVADMNIWHTMATSLL